MEFINDVDRIVLNISRNPVTYFNRNDSTDKGLFFKFIRKDHGNFYQTVKAGLEIIDRAYEQQNHTSFTVEKKTKKNKSIEDNYNIVPLRNMDYLTQKRSISVDSTRSAPFAGRIFNAYHIRDNGGKISNIAFPKYDMEGNIKNYILYNKPYRSKVDNTYKKFKLVLNKKDHFLFYSDPNLDTLEKIIFAEDGIDLLSYHELHGNEKNLYISFGGNIYTEKLESFLLLTEKFATGKNIEFVSAMDNDKAGYEYDIKIFAALINQWNPDLYIEPVFKGDNVSLRLHYAETVRDNLSKDCTNIANHLSLNFKKTDFVSDLVRTAAFSDKLVLEFSLNELVNTFYRENHGQNAFNILLKKINSLYLPFKTDIHKSIGKDWNEDLKMDKQTNYVKFQHVKRSNLCLGDKVELNTAKGPEGTKNQGIILELKNNGVLVDFGLKHHYAIPFSAIKVHYKKSSKSQMAENRLKTKKTRNIQSIQY